MSDEPWQLVIDTREQKPYRFSGVSDVVYRKLDVGDYTIDGYENDFAVERKTLDDLANSLGNERDRFERELERSVENGMDHLAVVIEAPRWHVYKYSGTKHSPKYFSQIYPNSIIGTVESWPDKYPPVTFRWEETRKQARDETLRLLDKWWLKRNVGD